MSTKLNQENAWKLKQFAEELLQDQAANKQKEQGAAVHLETMTVEDIRKYYKISRWTVSRWRKKGFIKVYKIGRKVLVDTISLEAFIRSCGDNAYECAN